MLSFACKDIGMQCPFKTTAKTEAELMEKIKEHAAKVHGMNEVPPNMEEQIKGAIKQRV